MISFSSLALMIDNDEAMLNYVKYMTVECASGVQCNPPLVSTQDVTQLVQCLSTWMEGYIEKMVNNKKYTKYETMMLALFLNEFDTIDLDEWEDLAQHYITKVTEAYRYGYEHKNVADPLI